MVLENIDDSWFSIIFREAYLRRLLHNIIVLFFGNAADRLRFEVLVIHPQMSYCIIFPVVLRSTVGTVPVASHVSVGVMPSVKGSIISVGRKSFSFFPTEGAPDFA